LIEKKLICQKPDPTDGRQFWLNLTPTGHRQFQSFRTQVKAVFAENIRKLPGSRQSELEAGLNVLTDLVSQF
jgi:DNA-binding MarR family transcriptional regulator